MLFYHFFEEDNDSLNDVADNVDFAIFKNLFSGLNWKNVLLKMYGLDTQKEKVVSYSMMNEYFAKLADWLAPRLKAQPTVFSDYLKWHLIWKRMPALLPYRSTLHFPAKVVWEEKERSCLHVWMGWDNL